MSKSEESKPVIKSISMPGWLYDAGVERMNAFGFPNFSDYVRALITADLQRRRKAFFTIIQEELESEKEDRQAQIENLEAELQWQKDPTRLAEIRAELRRHTSQPTTAPYVLNDEAKERKPKKTSH